MGYFFLDTSALAKRYVDELGSDMVSGLLSADPPNICYLADAASPEMIAELARRASGPLDADESLAQVASSFRRHWQEQYRRIELEPRVIERAMVLAGRYRLRGYDAVHLAAALELAEGLQVLDLSPLVFVSADTEQLAAAVAESLEILNPLAAPN